jgi:hypothetical protein
MLKPDIESRYLDSYKTQAAYSTLKLSRAAPLDKSKSVRPAFKSVRLMTAVLFGPSALITAPAPEA